MRKGNILRSVAFSLLWCVIMPFLAFSCTGAKKVENNAISSEKAVNSISIDSLGAYKAHLNNVYAHDSIYIHDSTIVLVRGDTVYKDRWHNRVVYKMFGRQKTDTIYKERVNLKIDTLKVIKNSEKTKFIKNKNVRQLVWLLSVVAIMFLIIIALAKSKK